MKPYIKIDIGDQKDLIAKGLKWFTEYSIRRHPILLSTALKGLSKVGIPYETHNIPDTSAVAVIDAYTSKEHILTDYEDALLFDYHWLKDVSEISGGIVSTWSDHEDMTPIATHYDLDKCLLADEMIQNNISLNELTFLSDAKAILGVPSDMSDRSVYWTPDKKRWWSIVFIGDGTFNFMVDLHSSESIGEFHI